MTILEMKRGDLLPALVITVTDPVADFPAVDTWKVLIRQDRSGVIIADIAPAVDTTTPNTAVITHTWVAGETDAVGTISVEVEATWPDGKPQTFPCNAFNHVSIIQDIQ